MSDKTHEISITSPGLPDATCEHLIGVREIFGQVRFVRLVANNKKLRNYPTTMQWEGVWYVPASPAQAEFCQRAWQEHQLDWAFLMVHSEANGWEPVETAVEVRGKMYDGLVFCRPPATAEEKEIAATAWPIIKHMEPDKVIGFKIEWLEGPDAA